jgi:hypothetical protein
MQFRRGKSIVSIGLVAARALHYGLRCDNDSQLQDGHSGACGRSMCPRGICWSGARVAEIYSIGIVDDEQRLTKVCSCGVSQFPSASHPLRYPYSRLTPQPPGNVRWRSVRGPRRDGSASPG